MSNNTESFLNLDGQLVLDGVRVDLYKSLIDGKIVVQVHTEDADIDDSLGELVRMRYNDAEAIEFE